MARADVTSEMGAASAGEGRLGAATSRLRRAAANLPAERWLLVAGWVLLPLGAVLIVLAWYGAAHTTRVWQQMPYAISGGLLGLGFMLAGSFGYFAYWLTKLVDDGRRHSAEAIRMAERNAAALERIESALRTGAGQTARRAGSDPAALVTTQQGKMVHRADCPMVAGKPNLRRVSASNARGLRPCLVCEPDVGAPR